eukprot:XP_001691542.1 predicted protein [Chlamydomonas reinhardtii]
MRVAGGRWAGPVALLVTLCAALTAAADESSTGLRSRRLLQSTWTYSNSVDLCGSSYGSPTLQFQSTAAFQQYGAVLGLEVTSENAQTNSADVKKYEVIYGIAGIHSNYPAPPGVRSTMVLGSPANGRTAFIQTEGNSAASGVQVRTIEVCCTPANYVGALNIIFSDNSRKKMGSQQCNKTSVAATAPANGQLASFRIWTGTQPGPGKTNGGSGVAVAKLVAFNTTEYFFDDASYINPAIQSLDLRNVLGTVLIAKASYSTVSLPSGHNVLYGNRFGNGRVSGTAAQSLVTRCCKAGSDPKMDSLLLRQVLWTAVLGIKLGGAKVRVSDPKFQPFAEWLVATSATLTGRDKNALKAPPNGNGNNPEWYLPLSNFTAQYNDPRFNKPGGFVVDLYIISADQVFTDELLINSTLSYVRDTGRGLFVVGSDLTYYDNLFNSTINGTLSNQTTVGPGGVTRRRHARRTLLSAEEEAALEDLRYGAMLMGRPGLAVDVTADPNGANTLEALTRHYQARRRMQSYTVNTLLGPMGISYSSTVLPAVSTIVVSSSTLTNCQQASIMYIYYLQGKIALGPADLDLAVKTISIARGSYSLTSATLTQLSCYKDNSNARALPYRLGGSAAMTVELCTSWARSAGYPFIGLQGTNCWAGYDLNLCNTYGTSSSCALRCGGNTAQICGNTGTSPMQIHHHQQQAATSAKLPQGLAAAGGHRALQASSFVFLESAPLCGSSYGSPTLQFQSTTAFQQYGAALGLEVTSENAQTNSADVKKYEAIYGIAGIHSNYPAPPGVRSTMVLGSPANGRTAFIQTEGNSAASGVQVRTIEVCCTPANYVGALNIIFSDNSRKKLGSQQCNKTTITAGAPLGGVLASFKMPIQRTLATVVLAQRCFSLASLPSAHNVLYGTRYGDGRVVGTAAKSITDLCCKAGSDPGTDSLLLRQALWAASYGTKLGGAKVRVSDPKFQPFAEWLVATSATLTGGDKNALKAPPNGNGNNPEWYLPIDVFTSQYNDPRFNKPGSFVVDLYIIGPDNALYGDYEVNRTVHSYVYNSSRGLFVIGPDQSYYDALWSTAAWASNNQTGTVVRRHRRQLSEGGSAAAPVPAVAAATYEEAAAALEELRLSSGLLEAYGDDYWGASAAHADLTGFRTLEELTRRYTQQQARRRLQTYTVNTLLGPMGITYSSTPLPAISTITVSSTTLTNCQQASIMYIYYLQGKIALGPADLNLAVKTISIARGSYSLSDPWASQYFWPYQDDIQFYGGVIPNQPPPSPPPPPPSTLKPPPPGTTTSTTALSYVNCFKDNANARALPYRLGGSATMSNAMCNGMAKTARYAYMGTQGTNCWAGPDLNLCNTYGTVPTQCTTRCPGNTATFCGSTSLSPMLLSVYKVV